MSFYMSLQLFLPFSPTRLWIKLTNPFSQEIHRKIWLARLNVAQLDSLLRTLGHEAVGDQFRPIVESKGLWSSAPGYHLL
jgi:hypothetical protein